ncbi:MAG: cupin domain-containing protein [Burkholderiaceae bacterium]
MNELPNANTTKNDGNATTEVSVRQVKIIYKLDKLRITHTQLDPHQEIPWHRHSKVSDTFYAVKGPVTIEVAGRESVVLLTGESRQVAPGQAHRVSNDGQEMVEFLLIQGVGDYDFELLHGRAAGEGLS